MENSLSVSDDPFRSLKTKCVGYFIQRRHFFFLCLFTCVYFCGSVQWIRNHSFPFPFVDAEANVPYVTGERPITWEWLWSQHNNHRLVFPRLWYLLFAIPTHCRETYICIANALWMLAATLVCLWGVSRIRGRSSYWDVFFPLLLLTPSLTHGNWMTAFNGCNMIPTSLLLLAGVNLMTWDEKHESLRTAILLVCIVLLSLCGIGHVLTANVLSLAAVLLVIRNFRSSSGLFAKQPLGKTIQTIACVLGVFFAIAVFVLYYVDYDPSLYGDKSIGIIPAVQASYYFSLTGILGPYYPVNLYSHVIGICLMGLLAMVSLLLLRDVRDGKDPFKALLKCVPFLAAVLLIGCIGWGRNAGGIGEIRCARLCIFSMPLYAFMFMILVGDKSTGLRKGAIPTLLFFLLLGMNNQVSLVEDGAFRNKVVNELYDYRYAGTIDNTVADTEYYSQNAAAIIVKHRLGLLQLLNPFYTFDDLDVVRKWDNPTRSDFVWINMDKNQIAETLDKPLLVSIDSVFSMIMIPDIVIPAEHYPVVQARFEEEKTGDLFLYEAYGADLYFQENNLFASVVDHFKKAQKVDLVLPVGKKLAGEKFFCIIKEKKDEPDFNWKKGTRGYKYLFPLPGRYYFHSVEVRALPIHRD